MWASWLFGGMIKYVPGGFGLLQGCYFVQLLLQKTTQGDDVRELYSKREISKTFGSFVIHAKYVVSQGAMKNEIIYSQDRKREAWTAMNAYSENRSPL